MHLRDAMIDDSGCVYGEGRMSFTPDPAGVFTRSDPALIQVAIRGPQSISLVPCSAERNPITGYLVPGPGPGNLTMILPLGLTQILLPALSASSFADPVTFALNAGGWLASGSGESATRRGLSDWRVSTSQVGQWITVRISAAMLSPESKSSFRQQDDQWPVDEEVAPRVEVEFRLDVMTAVLRFGGYSDALSSEYEQNPAPTARTSASDMRLESGPLGYNGSIYGIREDGTWVLIFESKREPRRKISISTLRDVSRNARGLLDAASGGSSVNFYGIDLDIVAAHLRMRNVFGVTFTEGEIGSVTWRTITAEGSEWSKIVEAKLRFELTLDGLEFHYSVLPTMPTWGSSDEPYISGLSAVDLHGNPLPWPPSEEHRFQETVTIPWEVLIIRSPLFVGHREKLLAGLGPDVALGGSSRARSQPNGSSKEP